MGSFRTRSGVVSISMSIHRVIRKSGERFVVRHRDHDGVNRSRVFATREDAERHQRRIEATKEQIAPPRAALERF
jgi:hypothetical protein